MLTYIKVLNTLAQFSKSKIIYNTLLQSRLNIIKLLESKYNDKSLINALNNTVNIETELLYISSEIKKITKEINKEKFKIKYYKQYESTFKTECEQCFSSVINIQLTNDTLFTDECKATLLNYKGLLGHKSLYKRIQIIFTDGIDTFIDKDINPILQKINELHKLINLDNNKLTHLDTLLKTPSNNTNNIDTSNIEAVPKILAEEGERPDDSDPIGQKVYDLRLLFGIGENKAMDFVKHGFTFQQLINEWNEFSTLEPDNDILMMEKLPDPPNINCKASSNIQLDKLLYMRFNYLKERMAINGFKGLSYCNYDQLVGIKHFKDMAHKIPRDEIVKMDKYLNIIVKHINPDLIITCCGSYRRGRDRSGDMDCLLTHTKLKTAEDINNYQSVKGHIISKLVNVLTNKGFITDHLSEGPKKYMGLCKLPNRTEYTIHRRIDIKLFPYNSYATGLLYFTGSKQLNKDMRNKALSMGYTLNEYGLYKLTYCKEKKKKIAGEQLNTTTEADVFKLLNMKYLEPTQRDI